MSVNKIRVLVLGRTGMLGHMVKRVLEDSHKLAVFGTQVDNRGKTGYFNAIEGKARLNQLFEKHGGFDYCINCIGITSSKISKKSNTSIRKAQLINSVFPGYLAEVANSYGCKIIHISTDGVFCGTKTSYYEDSLPDCADVYGRTKLGGEINSDNFLSIRCSIIGPSPYEKAGLWEWFANLPTGSQVNGFVNHVWNGVTTLQFSQLCRAIILRDRFGFLRSKSGIYHFAPNKPLSKYELLQTLKSLLSKDVTINKSTQDNIKISRILRTRFGYLRVLIPYGLTMRQAISQLLAYERKQYEQKEVNYNTWYSA